MSTAGIRIMFLREGEKKNHEWLMRCSLRRRKLGSLLFEAPDQSLVSTLWIKVDCSLKCDAGLRHRGA